MIEIIRTGEHARHGWPEGTFLQGGIPFFKGGKVRFVEAFPPEGSFFRGDAPTVAEAEDQCWDQYQRSVACPEHQWEVRGYTNGGGICGRCGLFGSHVFTGEQLGQLCHTCGVGTTYGQFALDAYWDPDASFTGVVNPKGSERFWFCEQHAPCRAEFAAKLKRLSEPIDEEVLADVLTRLAGSAGEDATQAFRRDESAEGDPGHL